MAVALHLIVIAALVIAFRWPAPTASNVQVIQAIAVDKTPAQKKAEEEKKKRELAKKRAAEQRKKEAARKKRLAAERQRKEMERTRREAEAKKRAEEQKRFEQEQQRLAAERQRLEEEKQRLEEARRQRQEQERQQVEDEQRQKEAEEQLAAMMAAEEQARKDAERQARALTETEKYKILIRQKVTRNWVRPPASEKGLKCTVRVKLVPGGEVLQVSVVKSSGDEVFDRSVENAVFKAAPLPLPGDRDLFEYFRDIEFLFNPDKQTKQPT